VPTNREGRRIVLHISFQEKGLIGKMLWGSFLKSKCGNCVKVAFVEFVDKANLNHKLIYKAKEIVNKDSVLYNKKIVITGFRSKELEEKLNEIGCKVNATITNDVFAVVAKDKNENSTKIEKAKKMDIMIYDLNEFVLKYLK